MHRDETTLKRLSECIIGCAFGVMNTLGSGFFGKDYENALAHELRKAALVTIVARIAACCDPVQSAGDGRRCQR